VKRAKQHSLPKPRNPVARSPLLRKGGAHGKSKGALRREANIALRKAVRNPATAQVVLTNRTNPPDSILREVWQRSGGRPFKRIEDVISTAELQAILDRYRKVSGFDRETLRTRPSFV